MRGAVRKVRAGREGSVFAAGAGDGHVAGVAGEAADGAGGAHCVVWFEGGRGMGGWVGERYVRW